MSFGKTALEILKKVAPTVATAVGGPFGGIAAAAVASALGVDSDNVEDAIISASPDTLLKVKMADHDFKVKMAELGIKEQQLAIREVEVHAEDRSSARTMAAKLGMWPQVVLSIVYTVGYFVMLYLLVSGHWSPPEGSQELVAGLVGVLTAGVVKVMDFWFGSSVGSKQKTAVEALRAQEVRSG